MKRLLLANLPEKLAAIAIAILLWQIVLRIEQPTSSLAFENVPVAYREPAGGLVATERTTRIHVDARVLLPSVARIDKSDISAIVDLSHAKVGRARYPVKVVYTGPADVSVELEARPREVEVVVEQWVQRELEVHPMTTGAWDLYRPGPITVTPPKVRISGPEGRLALATEARVEVNLTNVEPGSSSQAPVQVLTETGKPLEVTVDPSTVTVRVKAVALPPSKNVLVQPNWLGNPRFGYEIIGYEITPNQIRIEGPAEALANLLSVQTAGIDIEGIDSDQTRSVTLSLPTGVRSITASVRVRITIAKRPIEPSQDQ
ncbi:MAG TPA: CdaR family protein [Fimbriimonadales bacterium]|jgi:YbbR domain-containing protein|nr:CdaR family protein [Fimbriimonadales bacterium]